MGTRKDFPGWVPYDGLGTPLLFCPPFMIANSSATLRDRDRRASTAATARRIVPSIPESLCGRAWGCFSGPVGVRNGTRQRGGQQSTRGILGQEPRRPAISRAELIQHVSDLGGGSRRSCRTWRLNRALYTNARELPKSRIGKAKGFSRFLGRMITVLLSVVGVRKTIA